MKKVKWITVFALMASIAAPVAFAKDYNFSKMSAEEIAAIPESEKAAFTPAQKRARKTRLFEIRLQEGGMNKAADERPHLACGSKRDVCMKKYQEVMSKVPGFRSGDAAEVAPYEVGYAEAALAFANTECGACTAKMDSEMGSQVAFVKARFPKLIKEAKGSKAPNFADPNTPAPAYNQ